MVPPVCLELEWQGYLRQLGSQASDYQSAACAQHTPMLTTYRAFLPATVNAYAGKSVELFACSLVLDGMACCIVRYSTFA